MSGGKPAGYGGRLAGQTGETETQYLRAGLAANQIAIALNAAIVWDKIHAQRGNDISLNIANGQITLQPGTYELCGRLYLQHTLSFLVEFGWYDVTNATAIDGSTHTNRSTTASSHDSTGQQSLAIVAPSLATIYELRCTNPVTAGVNIKGDTGGTAYGRGSTNLLVKSI